MKQKGKLPKINEPRERNKRKQEKSPGEVDAAGTQKLKEITGK